MYTNGGRSYYAEELTTEIVPGSEKGLFAVDQLSPPYENPWNWPDEVERNRLS